MASAAVGLFGSEGCVQFTRCSRSYGGELLNIHGDVSPAIPWVGIPTEKPHEITYYCLFFKKLAQESLFISETDSVTIG